MLWSRSATSNRVDLSIGGIERHAVMAREHKFAKISIRVRVAGKSLTIRAVGQRRRPSLVVSIRRLASLRKPPSPGTAHPTAPSSSTPPSTSTTPSGTTPAPSTPVSAGTPGSTNGGSPPPAITSWVPSNRANFTPLSDQAAAADVIPTPENRPGNDAANSYLPTAAQLQAFYAATDSNANNILADNPYLRSVTGHCAGTTDEIIQWAAWKWGVPEDWLRAQYVVESYWRQSTLGNQANRQHGRLRPLPAAGPDRQHQ